jgi:glutathione S-transferase
MLELYHGGPAANSLKALLPLNEKGVEFTSHVMNLLQFEQHEPWFVKINPSGQVPVLVHDCPRVVDWYARMMERPGVKATLAIPRPSREFLEAQQKEQEKAQAAHRA